MIFLSFRKPGSAPTAAHIDYVFQNIFGTDAVFRSSRSIKLGTDYRIALLTALQRCDVMLVVIGEDWFGVCDDGSRKIDDPLDWVHREVATGLRRGIPVIPILIDESVLPSADQLPTPLRELAYRQYLRLNHRSIDFDMRKLVWQTAELLNMPRTSILAAGFRSVSRRSGWTYLQRPRSTCRHFTLLRRMRRAG